MPTRPVPPPPLTDPYSDEPAEPLPPLPRTPGHGAQPSPDPSQDEPGGDVGRLDDRTVPPRAR